AVELREERPQHLLAEAPAVDVALAAHARLRGDDAALASDQPREALDAGLRDQLEALLGIGLDAVVEPADQHVEKERRQRKDEREQRADCPMMEAQPHGGKHLEALS